MTPRNKFKIPFLYGGHTTLTINLSKLQVLWDKEFWKEPGQILNR